MSELTTELQSNPLFERDARGLVKGVIYKFKPNGKIDWRGMVNEDYVIFNPQRIDKFDSKYGKTADYLKTSDVDDGDLMILLHGIRELADLRGVLDYDPTPVYVADNHATVKSRITWVANFETCGQIVSSGGIGGATLENTAGFGQLYLESIAENRSLVRNVRQFLGINIVGRDEVGGKATKIEPESTNKTVPFSSNALLEKRCKDKGISFETFRKDFLKKFKDKLPLTVDIERMAGFGDLRPIDATNFLEILKTSL